MKEKIHYTLYIKNLEDRVIKLEQLLLLTDPSVEDEEVGPLTLKQWAEYVKSFPKDINE